MRYKVICKNEHIYLFKKLVHKMLRYSNNHCTFKIFMIPCHKTNCEQIHVVVLLYLATVN